MKFRIEEKIFQDFEKPFIGVVIARGINNQNNNPEIAKLLREAETNLRKQFEGVEVSQHPQIAPWREADRTKLAKETKNAILVIESLAPISQEIAEKATKELAELVQKYCGGSVETFFLNEENKEITF